MANGVADSLIAYLSNERLSLPTALAVEDLADQVEARLTAHEGATINLYFGNMAGQVLYAVSLYPERSVVIPGRAVTKDLLRRFVKDNRDLLTDPRNSIGIWYSEALNAVYLDVSAALPGRSEAISLGEWYNQEVVYDLAEDEVIDTGGSGEQRGGWVEETQRLPPLGR